MNIFLHPSIDRLYHQYNVEDLSEYWAFNIRWKAWNAELLSELSLDSWCWKIKSIEWNRVWHELMILFLIEMYYYKIQTIHLEASPFISRYSKPIIKKDLVRFYKRFWFIENPVAQDPRYPHMTPMILQSWEWLKVQVQEYVRRTMLQT